MQDALTAEDHVQQVTTPVKSSQEKKGLTERETTAASRAKLSYAGRKQKLKLMATTYSARWKKLRWSKHSIKTKGEKIEIVTNRIRMEFSL